MVSLILYAISGFVVSAICTLVWVELLKGWSRDNGTAREKLALNVGAVLIAGITPAFIVGTPIMLSIFLEQNPMHPLFWESLWTSGTVFATQLCILRYIESRICKNSTSL